MSKSCCFVIDGKHCGTRKFKDITLGDGFYTSVMVNTTMECQYSCWMEGDKCDYVEIKDGEIGILCLLFHGKDITIQEQEEATVLQKICPKGNQFSRVRTKPVFVISNQVRLKLGCTAKEDG